VSAYCYICVLILLLTSARACDVPHAEQLQSYMNQAFLDQSIATNASGPLSYTYGEVKWKDPVGCYGQKR
jgi:hypothetical protein